MGDDVDDLAAALTAARARAAKLLELTTPGAFGTRDAILETAVALGDALVELVREITGGPPRSQSS